MSSGVRADARAVQDAIRLHDRVVQYLKAASKRLMGQYQDMGNGWSDSQYARLGDTVYECINAIHALADGLENSVDSLKDLLDAIEAYESISLGGAGGGADGGPRNQILQMPGTGEASPGTPAQRLQNLGVRHVNMEGLSPAVQVAVAEGFEKMAELFPESVGIISTVDTEDMICRDGNNDDITIACLGPSIPGSELTAHMRLNRLVMGCDDVGERLANSERYGHSSTGTVQGVICHEIAHALHLQLDANLLGMSIGDSTSLTSLVRFRLGRRWGLNTTTNQIRDQILNRLGLSREDVDEVSFYAAAEDNGSECFAECFADYAISSSPHAISVAIVEEYLRIRAHLQRNH